MGGGRADVLFFSAIEPGGQRAQFLACAFGQAFHRESMLKEHHPEEGGDDKCQGPEDFGEETHAGNFRHFMVKRRESSSTELRRGKKL